MRERLLLGPVLFLILIGGIWLDEHLTTVAMPFAFGWAKGPNFPRGFVLFIVMFSIGIFAARELAAILEANGVTASKRVMTTAATLGILVSCLVPSWSDAVDSVALVSTAAAATLFLSLAFYSRNKSVEGVVAAAGGALLAFVYLGLMFGFLLAIRREHSAWVLLWVLFVTKACDIGAYFTGKAIGRHKLIPWLSPGKTWEGLIGGVVLSAIVSWAGLLLLERFVGVGVPKIWWALLPGVLLGLTGQAGDLVESMFKRDAGIKDSGGALPGFGGVLDVLDSPLLVGPVAYWLLTAYVDGGHMTFR